MRLKTLLSYLLLLSWLPIAMAMDSQAVIDSAERIQFAKGQFSAVMTGQMDTNTTEKHYVLRANSGQTMSIQLNSNTPYSFIAVFQVVGNNKLQGISSSSTTPSHWSNTLTSNADYIIRVGLTQSDAIKTHYRLEVSVYSSNAASDATPPTTSVTAPTISTPAIKSVEESVKDAAEKAIPEIAEPKETATNNVGMLVTSSEIEGDYILDRKANLNVLKIFGNRVFVRITGLGQTTCNFTGSGLLTSDIVTIHNKFIGETLQFAFLPDTVIVRSEGTKAGAFCAGDMTVVGQYVRPHLLPPVQIAKPSQSTPTNTSQAKNVIDMLQCRCSVFNRESVAIQQIMKVWMDGFRQAKKASTQLNLDLSKTNMEASLAELARYCATNANLYLLQVHDDLAQKSQQPVETEDSGAFAFMRKWVRKVESMIDNISSNELDMSRHFCHDFRKQGEENQRTIMSWVLGYGQGRIHDFSEIPVDFTVNFLDQNIRVLSKYCADHESETLINAADALSSR
jgi:hypothetical protein